MSEGCSSSLRDDESLGSDGSSSREVVDGRSREVVAEHDRSGGDGGKVPASSNSILGNDKLTNVGEKENEKAKVTATLDNEDVRWRSSSSALSQYTRLTVKLRAPIRLGEEVHILGDGVLGSFDPERSIPLVTSPKTYPIWETSTPLMVPSNCALSYKFAIYRGGKLSTWEDIETDRVVIPRGPAMTIEDELDHYIHDPEALARALALTQVCCIVLWCGVGWGLCCCVVLCYIMLCCVVLYYLTLYYLTLFCIISHYIISHCIVS